MSVSSCASSQHVPDAVPDAVSDSVAHAVRIRFQKGTCRVLTSTGRLFICTPQCAGKASGNTLSGRVFESGDLEADIQASAISAGLRFEYKLETDYLDFIPHVGVRYMSINTWGYDVDSSAGTVLEGDGFQQNIWTFPVGITFAKDVTFDNGWYVTPALDFTVIPAAGDIKAREDIRFTGMLHSCEVETQMMEYFTWQGGAGIEFGNDGQRGHQRHPAGRPEQHRSRRVRHVPLRVLSSTELHPDQAAAVSAPAAAIPRKQHAFPLPSGQRVVPHTPLVRRTFLFSQKSRPGVCGARTAFLVCARQDVFSWANVPGTAGSGREQ